MPVQTLIAQAVVNGLVLGALYFLMAVGFTMVFGIMRVVNFAHGEFYMFGGFVVLFLFGMHDVPFLVALVAAGIFVGCFGVLVEQAIFKPFRGDTLSSMISALGLSIVLQNGAALAFGTTPQSLPDFATGLSRWGAIVIPNSRLAAVAIGAIIMLVFWLFIRFSETGRAMRAVVQDPEVAMLQGMQPRKIYPIAFGIGVGLAALAGGIMGSIFTVDPFMGITPLLKAFIVVILGGLGSVMGAVVAGIMLGLFESFASNFLGATAADLLQFILVILVLLFRPEGLLGEREA
ncbi:MAG: branched-chain amino acid ABC transporter permease [Bradyrhizobium sp.]